MPPITPPSSPSSISAASPPNTTSLTSTSQTSNDALAADEAQARTAKKARIIKHMNADHRDSLALYLRHYHSIPAPAAQGASLVDITFASLAIEGASTKAYAIPIDPPLESWADIRPRLVEMDGKCRAALGLAGSGGGDDHDGDRRPGMSQARRQVEVTEYIPPNTPIHFFVIGLVFFLCGSIYSYRQNWLVPGNWYYENIMRHFPYGPRGYLFMQNWIGVPVFVGAHAGETLWMVGRLGKYRVTRGVWWKWVASTALEGLGAHQRFGDVIRKAEWKQRAQ